MTSMGIKNPMNAGMGPILMASRVGLGLSVGRSLRAIRSSDGTR